MAAVTQWSAGEKYEPYVGRWSRLVAAEFVAWLDLPAGLAWLDVGCGTGALSETVLRSTSPSRLLGVDSSSAYVEHAREHVRDDLAEFAVSDAVALDVPDETFDAVVSGLVLNFVPEPMRAVLEMRRAARDGGVVAAYVWDYPGEMWMMRHFWDVATALDPAAAGAVRGEPVLVLPPGGARVLVHGLRSGCGRVPRDRRTDRVLVVRRLLDAVPGRPGTGAVLCPVTRRTPPRHPSRGPPRTPAHCRRRLHPPHGPSLGRPRPSSWLVGIVREEMALDTPVGGAISSRTIPHARPRAAISSSRLNA